MSARPYHHGDLRAALLTAAERTVRENGAAALSLRELARDIGVSHAAPGRHFKDRQALLDALALTGYERLITGLEQAGGTGTRERVDALATAYLGFAVDNAELLRIMYTSKHHPEVSARLTAAVGRMGEIFRDAISDGQRAGDLAEGDPIRVALVLVATLHGLAAFSANGAFTPEETLGGIGDVLDRLWSGLSPR
ncbi:TetR/AcrR family transcriptional regulator [Phytomonospora endophytica]|uniref:AcrR family transcriptional regulator n=1 Tax=Phytomonospora endophytica TaxID=714109 RepID=A0A841FIC8_9ACTN|nr:TetR/AcrR family transcriptional regulator [Phytomonospora endophytica]MBB6034713.1 AcrR family transcriptional regulator [Phytomonospora endophytica]GIG69084.1 TetR family transcriptional regulator [Phytomonospora endophytica]